MSGAPGHVVEMPSLGDEATRDETPQVRPLSEILDNNGSNTIDNDNNSQGGEGANSDTAPVRGVKLAQGVRAQLFEQFRDVLEERADRQGVQDSAEEDGSRDEDGGMSVVSDDDDGNFFNDPEASVAGIDDLPADALRPVYETRYPATSNIMVNALHILVTQLVLLVWMLLPLSGPSSDDADVFVIATLFHALYTFVAAATSLLLLSLIWTLSMKQFAMTLGATCALAWFLVGPVHMAGANPDGFSLQIPSCLAVGMLYVCVCAWIVAINDSQGRNKKPHIRVRCAGHVGIWLVVIASFYVCGMLVRHTAHSTGPAPTVAPILMVLAVMVLEAFALFASNLAHTIDEVAPQDVGIEQFISYYSRVFYTSVFLHLLLHSRSTLSYVISLIVYLFAEATAYLLQTRQLRALRSIITKREPAPPARAHLQYERRVTRLSHDAYLHRTADLIAFFGYVFMVQVLGSPSSSNARFFMFGSGSTPSAASRFHWGWAIFVALILTVCYFVRRGLAVWWSNFQDPNWRPDGSPAPPLSRTPVTLLHDWRHLALLFVSGTWAVMMLPLSLAHFGDPA